MKRLRQGSTRPLIGEVSIPGDKSISHRALILAALAPGPSLLARANFGADVKATARALTQLGATCTLDEDNRKVKVEGVGWSGLGEPQGVIDAGNSGSTIRMLLGLCASIPGLIVLTGDASLRRRPMLRVAAPLRQMGASIDGREHGNLAPLAIRGRELAGIEIELPVASAQVKSALLLAGLNASGTTTVSEPGPSRDHTERMLAALGVEVRTAAGGVSVDGGSSLEPFSAVIPGDVSSAMFLVAAAAIVPGSDLTMTDVGLNPTRRAALDVLAEMGSDVSWAETSSSLGEPTGTIHLSCRPLRGGVVPPALVPSLIDEIPALAIVASQADGDTVFTGAAELRVKESDRIRTLVAGLRTLGADADELPDGLVVRGPSGLRGGEIDSHGDHRIALAFAIAGLVCPDKVRVIGWSSVETSFPEFLEILGEATR
jgi:3-phosphoshikimate 1-carboxyvinyltransferase